MADLAKIRTMLTGLKEQGKAASIEDYYSPMLAAIMDLSDGTAIIDPVDGQRAHVDEETVKAVYNIVDVMDRIEKGEQVAGNELRLLKMHCRDELQKKGDKADTTSFGYIAYAIDEEQARLHGEKTLPPGQHGLLHLMAPTEDEKRAIMQRYEAAKTQLGMLQEIVETTVKINVGTHKPI